MRYYVIRTIFGWTWVCRTPRETWEVPLIRGGRATLDGGPSLASTNLPRISMLQTWRRMRDVKAARPDVMRDRDLDYC